MFAMYDDDGLNFRSTIDNLYNIHEVTSTHRIHNDTKDKQNKQNFEDRLYGGKIDQEAKNKYKQIANLDTRTEIFHVEQIMSHNAIIVNDSLTIKECYDIMQTKKIQQLLIRANGNNKLKGMITQIDILDLITTNIHFEDDILQKHLFEIDTKNVISTYPISDIRRVSKVMIDFNLNAIPVVDKDGIIVGIISRYDIVKAVSSIPHLQIWA